MHLHSLLCRLIKGDGEIVEELVSKERQQQINKVAMYKRRLGLNVSL